MTKWKNCAKCGRQLFADELNFGRCVDGSWKDVCKDCVLEEKIEREKRREERRARKMIKQMSNTPIYLTEQEPKIY